VPGSSAAQRAASSIAVTAIAATAVSAPICASGHRERSSSMATEICSGGGSGGALLEGRRAQPVRQQRLYAGYGHHPGHGSTAAAREVGVGPSTIRKRVQLGRLKGGWEG